MCGFWTSNKLMCKWIVFRPSNHFFRTSLLMMCLKLFKGSMRTFARMFAVPQESLYFNSMTYALTERFVKSVMHSISLYGWRYLKKWLLFLIHQTFLATFNYLNSPSNNNPARGSDRVFRMQLRPLWIHMGLPWRSRSHDGMKDYNVNGH